MKILSIPLLLSLAVHSGFAEGLTEADRETLITKLQAIREDADSKVDARFRVAISAFKSAMTNEDTAVDLYLKCEEMVNFEEMNKDSGNFRDWRRKNADKISDKNFRLALRHQLRWLVLTLEAASEDPDRDKLAAEAGILLDSIMSQAQDLSAHRSVLEQSVIGSVFARAYSIKNIKVEQWPLSPVQLDPIYEQVILPPLRRSDRLAALKSAWTRRMLYEGTVADFWSGKPEEKLKNGTHSLKYEQFVSDTLPKRQWESELDLFKAGDERGAAVRMLAHIEKNLSHNAAPKWAADFIGLLQEQPVPTSPSTETQQSDPSTESEQPAPLTVQDPK